jgi:hypothetical protein
MPYRYALDRPDYSDLASGKVLLAAPGYPAFPVRLASEVFQRCLAFRIENGLTKRVILYDPCCGAAYHLAVLGFLHRGFLRAIAASDIDPQAVSLAGKNLRMLSFDGLDRRSDELAELYRLYGKETHREALVAAGRLRKILNRKSSSPPLAIHVFRANALEKPRPSRLPCSAPVDIVFTDVPYGRHSLWQIPFATAQDPLWLLLESLLAILHPGSLVAVVFDKHQKTAHERYERVDRFQIGKRRVCIWTPKSGCA